MMAGGAGSLEGARARIAALAARREPTPEGGLDRVQQVMVLASSSRGGSSMFLELLRRHAGLINLQAEFNPFLGLVGRTWPDSGAASDALTAADADLPPEARALLERELLLDMMVGGTDVPLTDRVRQRLATDIAWRLCAQWPQLDIDADAVVDAVHASLAWVEAEHGRDPLDTTALHLQVLRRLRVRHPALSPWRYDADPGRVADFFPGEAPRHPRLDGRVLEEPPFVMVGPRRRPTDDELASLPLVIKAPSNAYRLSFLRALFPNARLRILHLTRNPAASINGLVDGWLYRGFHAHLLDRPLRITGYADVRPEDACYWKFDLPPGWQDWTSRPLSEVCGFQWRSTHEHVLRWLDDHPEVERGGDLFRLRFEDVVGPGPQRLAAFEALSDWLRQPLRGAFRDAAVAGLPPIMSTSPPRRRRWYARADLLADVLADPAILSVAERLGYGDPDTWI